MGKSKFEKECSVCRSAYKYCSGCSDYAKYPRWMESFCSDNCRKIFKAEMDYRAGVKAIDQAKSELLECDLSKKDQFPENLRLGVEAILSYKEESKSQEVDAPVVEETPADDIQEITTDGAVDEAPADETPVEDVAAEDAPAEDKPQKQYNNNKNNKFNGYKKVNHKR